MSKTVKRMFGAALLLYVYPVIYLTVLAIDSLREPEVLCFDCYSTFQGVINPLVNLTIWQYACGVMMILGLSLTFAALWLHKQEKVENARY